MAVIAVVASIVVTFGLGAAAGYGTASPATTSAATLTAISRIVTAVPPTNGVGRTQPTSTGGRQQPSDPSAGGPTNLSAIKPVQIAGSIGNFTTGSVQIGTTTYPNSVRFTCGSVVSGPGNVVYNVAGFKFLNTTIGVPNDATNGIGDTMAITFFKDGSTQLGSPLNIVLGQPQTVHLDLQGASQLELQCLPTNNVSNNQVSMDIALGDATISPA